MKNKTKGTCVRWGATALCVGAPLGATIAQFPVWVATSDKATMSGLFLVMAFICCLPFVNQLKAYFKSPAIWVVWTVAIYCFTQYYRPNGYCLCRRAYFQRCRLYALQTRRLHKDDTRQGG